MISEIANNSSFEQEYFLTNLAHFFDEIDSQVEVDELEQLVDDEDDEQVEVEVEVLSE